MPRKNGISRCWRRSEEHTSELQSLTNLVCRLLLEKKQGRCTPRVHVHTAPDQFAVCFCLLGCPSRAVLCPPCTLVPREPGSFFFLMSGGPRSLPLFPPAPLSQ